MFNVPSPKDCPLAPQQMSDEHCLFANTARFQKAVQSRFYHLGKG